MKLITLSKIEAGQAHYNEDTGQNDAVETREHVVIHAETIRNFYARRGGKPGTRITFTDGGGYAVAESVEVITAALVTLGAVHTALAAEPAEPAPAQDPVLAHQLPEPIADGEAAEAAAAGLPDDSPARGTAASRARRRARPLFSENPK
jgi:hypothetical protein